jgi:hypothetical protein
VILWVRWVHTVDLWMTNLLVRPHFLPDKVNSNHWPLATLHISRCKIFKSFVNCRNEIVLVSPHLWIVLFSWLSCFHLWMFSISVMNLELIVIEWSSFVVCELKADLCIYTSAHIPPIWMQKESICILPLCTTQNSFIHTRFIPYKFIFINILILAW